MKAPPTELVKDYTDLNKPADADETLWLDRRDPEVMKRYVPFALRVQLTPDIQRMLREMRAKAGVNITDAAASVKRVRGWLTMVETGELQTINEQDFNGLVAFYRGVIDTNTEVRRVMNPAWKKGGAPEWGGRAGRMTGGE